jgi:protein transport protein SEC20
MSDELSRSRFAQETLQQSTAALEDLGEKYSDLNTLLANSKNLVSTLLKSTKSDTWYLETTFYILATTIIWLIFRRWIYGPLTWFIIWPLKLTFRILFAVLPFGASAAAKSNAAVSPSTTLIVQPSATGGIPLRERGAQPFYIPVGRGGHRGPVPSQDPSPQGSYSQSVGQMAAQNQQQQQQDQEEVPDHPQFRKQVREEDDGPVTLGDGTVLKESDKPRNPKKKMWDEGVETAKREQAQQQGEQHQDGGAQRRKRDEL